MTTLIPVISALRETWEEGADTWKRPASQGHGLTLTTASLCSVACLRLCFALSYLWPASPGIWPCSPYLSLLLFSQSSFLSLCSWKRDSWPQVCSLSHPQVGPTAVRPTFINSLPLSLDHLWKWWRQQPRSWIHYGNIGTSGAFIKR